MQDPNKFSTYDIAYVNSYHFSTTFMNHSIKYISFYLNFEHIVLRYFLCKLFLEDIKIVVKC